MANWNYGRSLDGWIDDLMKYDKGDILEMLKKYYPEISGNLVHTGYFGTMDSVLLYSFIREYKTKKILEIGGGTSTRVMFQALEKNNVDANLTSYAIKRTIDLPSPPKNVDYKFYEGDFLDSYFVNKPKLEDIDFVFIDAAHESYFASFYCYEILKKVKPGTLIHIHDVQEPDVLLEGYEKGWYKLGEYSKNPTITDEIFTVYLFMKNEGGYKVLCRANDLLEKNSEKLRFIENVENCLYVNALKGNKTKGLIKRKETRSKEETQASSFYMIKEK